MVLYHAVIQFWHPTLLLPERQHHHHASPCPVAMQKLMARAPCSVLLGHLDQETQG